VSYNEIEAAGTERLEEEEPALLAMASSLSGKGGFKLRGVGMSLVLI
jgi:hypothetical protein